MVFQIGVTLVSTNREVSFSEVYIAIYFGENCTMVDKPNVTFTGLPTQDLVSVRSERSQFSDLFQ